MVQVNRAVSASHISSFWRPVLTPKKRPAAVLRRTRARAAVRRRLVPIVTSRHASHSSRVTLGSVWCPHTGEVSIQLITHRHNPGPSASGDPEWGRGTILYCFLYRTFDMTNSIYPFLLRVILRFQSKVLTYHSIYIKRCRNIQELTCHCISTRGVHDFAKV